jgi:DNA-binding PadR family transcriptional regulator
MEIPIYILGLLRRFGPLYGYQIRKIITEEIADFARIKLPTIYYHLQRMEAEGLLSAESEKDSNRPERRVYSITSRGDSAFAEGLENLLSIEYEPSFETDALLYFSDSMDIADILTALEAHLGAMENALATIKNHKAVAIKVLPAENKIWAETIFNHHEQHYKAEAAWVIETIAELSSHRISKSQEA